MARTRNDNGAAHSGGPLVNAIAVDGFKSIEEQQRIEIRPLTILAGANSSGKSSMMQPALLIKQTLESPYDPGVLRIDGPNVKMTEFDQLFWGTGTDLLTDKLDVGFEFSDGERVMSVFKGSPRDAFAHRAIGAIQLEKQIHVRIGKSFVIRPTMSQRSLKALIGLPELPVEPLVRRDRCFLVVEWPSSPPATFNRVWPISDFVRNLIHVPGLRPRTAERLYPRTAVGDAFPGTFDDYFASVLRDWKRNQSEEIENVGRDLEAIGLTWKVDVEEIGDTALTILVGRLPDRPSRGGTRDLVNLADVGIGVSQALPVVVALRAAKPGDTVYTEQPEVHLHPRAQVRMASILADAVNRGVRVIAETHSSLLLLGIQALVAERKLSSDLVKLHWFQRDKRGATSVTSADLDKNGAFGDWPEDFADVSLKAQGEYLDAVETRSSSR